MRGLTTQWAAQGPGEWDKCGAGCRPHSWILVQCLVQLFSCHRDNKPPLSSDLTQRDRAPGLCVGPAPEMGRILLWASKLHSPTPLFASKPRKSFPSSIRKQTQPLASIQRLCLDFSASFLSCLGMCHPIRPLLCQAAGFFILLHMLRVQNEKSDAICTFIGSAKSQSTEFQELSRCALASQAFSEGI